MACSLLESLSKWLFEAPQQPLLFVLVVAVPIRRMYAHEAPLPN